MLRHAKLLITLGLSALILASPPLLAAGRIECGRYRVQGKLIAPKKVISKSAMLEVPVPKSKKTARIKLKGLGKKDIQSHRGRWVSVEVDITQSATLSKLEAGVVFGSLKKLPASVKNVEKMQLLQRDRCH